MSPDVSVKGESKRRKGREMGTRCAKGEARLGTSKKISAFEESREMCKRRWKASNNVEKELIEIQNSCEGKKRRKMHEEIGKS